MILKRYFNRLYKSPIILYVYKNYLSVYTNFRRLFNQDIIFISVK